MEERTVHLKIKIRSLADEAKSIRREANKSKGMAKWRLNDHRTSVVRDHARHNLLAYGILIGTPYKAMEGRCYRSPDFSRISTIAKRFGANEEAVAKWVEEAKAHLEPRQEAA